MIYLKKPPTLKKEPNRDNTAYLISLVEELQYVLNKQESEMQKMRDEINKLKEEVKNG